MTVSAARAHANRTADNYSATTSLMLAAASGREGMVRTLLGCTETATPDTQNAGLRFMRDNAHHTEGMGTPYMPNTARYTRDAEASIINDSAYYSQDERGRTALMHACSGGHTGVVRILALHNPLAAAETCDNEGRTAAIVACEGGHYDCMHALGLVIPWALQVTDENGYTLAMRAVRAGHAGTALSLLRDGSALVTDRDAAQNTIAMLAISLGDTRLVRALVCDHGADVAARDACGRTGFMQCVYANKTAHILAMLAMGVLCAGTHDKHGRTAMMIAAKTGNVTAVRGIIARARRCDNGLESMHDVDGRGWSPLIIAAHEGHAEVVWALVQECPLEVCAFTASKWTALLVAASAGHTQVVRTLVLRCGVNVQEHMHGEWSMLSRATDGGHSETVTALVCECGVDVDVQEGSGWTALMHAVKNGDTPTVVALGGVCNADVNIKNHLGINALMMASELGSLEHVRFLCMECKAEPDVLALEIRSALMAAAANAHTAVVVALVVECAASVDLTNKYGWTALHSAAQNKNSETVRALVSVCGANTNVACLNYGGYSGIHYTPAAFSAEAGDLDSLRVFLDAPDCDIRNTCLGRHTILSTAAALGLTAVVDCLVCAGAEVDAVDEELNTALMMCCMNGHLLTACTLVRTHGADVHHKNRSGNTAFGLACVERHYNLMVLLAKEFGADTNAAVNCFGSTPLCYTIAYGSLVGSMLLLDHCGVDATALDPEHTNPLMIAAIHSRLAVLPVLIHEHRLDVNARNISGFTALIFAVNYGSDATVAALLALDARTDIQDVCGNCAYHFAAKRLRRPVVNMLIDAYMTPHEALAFVFAECAQYAQPDKCAAACLPLDLVLMILKLYTQAVVESSPFVVSSAPKTTDYHRALHTTPENTQISADIQSDIAALFRAHAYHA